MREIFLLNLIYNIAGNNYEGSSDLFCIFHEPLIKQCNDRPQIFEILNETKQFEIACDIFYDKESEEEHKINSLRFIEDWCINDCLHDLAMQNLNDNIFLSLINYIDNSCNDIKSSLLGIFTYILDCHEFIYAETIVDRGILNVIDNFIGTNTIKALKCLDIIFKHYVECKSEKEIIKLINNTEIIDNLNSAVENTTNEEEVKPIIEFLQKISRIQ